MKSDDESKKINMKMGIVVFCIVIVVAVIFGAYLVNSERERENCDSRRELFDWGSGGSVDKPIIYLYPEEEINVNVKLGNFNALTCTYPKYNSNEGWNVIAKPNGDLLDISNGRKLYALYWEGKADNRAEKEEGFIVKGEDSAKFLEEKLEILGLNEKESEEFIIYWLPKLEASNYNYIRFLSEEEIEKNMPLLVNPKPDTVIRIVMEFKGLEEYKEIKEQNLMPKVRNGFTVVEWGGTEIK